MIDDIDDDINYDNDAGSNVDADTSVVDLDTSRLDNIDVDVNTAQISINAEDEPSLFAASNLLRKTSDNLARSEAMVDERPLRTEKTSEIESRENQERDN